MGRGKAVSRVTARAVEDPDISESPEDVYEHKPTMLASLGMVALVAAFLLVGTVVLEMPIEMVLFFSMVTIMIFLRFAGYTFRRIQDAAFDSVRQVIELLLILLSVGMLLSSWAMAGTIPTIIKYGLELISPMWFLPTAVLLCSVVSFFTGTSWGTMGSVGVALMAVGGGLGLPLPLVAGAVISGAYFGDKLSMLSDSTNLNAAITATPLMTHIRYMLWTTGPAYAVTLVLFSVIGILLPRSGALGSEIVEITSGLESSYRLGLVTLIPLVVTVAMLLLRLPPFMSIVMGAIAGAVIAVLYQGRLLRRCWPGCTAATNRRSGFRRSTTWSRAAACSRWPASCCSSCSPWRCRGCCSWAATCRRS